MQIPFTLLADNVQIMYLEHVRTVARMCIAMEKVIKEAYGPRATRIDHDTLVAGALHGGRGQDARVRQEGRGRSSRERRANTWRHPFSGVASASSTPSPTRSARVATHSKEGDHVKRFPESIIFHHATSQISNW